MATMTLSRPDAGSGAGSGSRPKARDGEEIWEITTPGRVWLTVTERGKDKDVSVGGVVGARLRISTEDRQINQDRLLDDADPFTNGLLKRIDSAAGPTDNSDQALDADDLMVGFTKSGKAFHAYVDKMNELNVRRMREMCQEVDASTSQTAYLDEVIKTKYRQEGDTQTYRELKATGEIH